MLAVQDDMVAALDDRGRRRITSGRQRRRAILLRGGLFSSEWPVLRTC
jgi:hypothetical protein